MTPVIIRIMVIYVLFQIELERCWIRSHQWMWIIGWAHLKCTLYMCIRERYTTSPIISVTKYAIAQIDAIIMSFQGIWQMITNLQIVSNTIETTMTKMFNEAIFFNKETRYDKFYIRAMSILFCRFA